MRHRPTIVLTLALLAACWIAACDNTPSAPDAEHADIAAMRQAAASFEQLSSATAAGFVPLSGCVASPAGGMGYHYGNLQRISDAVIDARNPEILLYEPVAGGGMRLVGVEFMVHHGAWHGAGNTAAPALAGRTFDAPDPNHPDEQLREMYTLHAWVVRHNPSGMFAPFNPDVSCAQAGATADTHSHH